MKTPCYIKINSDLIGKKIFFNIPRYKLIESDITYLTPNKSYTIIAIGTYPNISDYPIIINDMGMKVAIKLNRPDKANLTKFIKWKFRIEFTDIKREVNYK